MFEGAITTLVSTGRHKFELTRKNPGDHPPAKQSRGRIGRRPCPAAVLRQPDS